MPENHRLFKKVLIPVPMVYPMTCLDLHLLVYNAGNFIRLATSDKKNDDIPDLILNTLDPTIQSAIFPYNCSN